MCWRECLWYINPIRVWQPRLFFLQFRWWWWWWRSWPGFCICCPSGWCLLLLLLQISLWGSETLFLRSVVLQTPARSSTASCSTRAAPAPASTSTPSSRKTQVRWQLQRFTQYRLIHQWCKLHHIWNKFSFCIHWDAASEINLIYRHTSGSYFTPKSKYNIILSG